MIYLIHLTVHLLVSLPFYGLNGWVRGGVGQPGVTLRGQAKGRGSGV